MHGMTSRWTKRLLTLIGAVAVMAFAVDAIAQPAGGRGARQGAQAGGQRGMRHMQSADGQPYGPPPGGPGRRGPNFEALDANGDGVLTFEEVSVLPRMNEEHFAEVDTDGNGTLDTTEFPPRRGQGPGPHGPGLPEVDTNGDGQITWEEASVLPHMTDEHFGWLDRNDDGVITEDEMPRGPRGGHGPRIAEIDTDGDGLITWEEASVLPRMTEEHFNELDANGDGVIDESERPQGPPAGGRGFRGAKAGESCPRTCDNTASGATQNRGARRGPGR